MAVPFDQSEIENELDKIKIFNSSNEIMDSVLEKIKSNTDLKITGYSKWGMPVPMLKCGSEIITDSEIINRFSEVLGCPRVAKKFPRIFCGHVRLKFFGSKIH